MKLKIAFSILFCSFSICLFAFSADKKVKTQTVREDSVLKSISYFDSEGNRTLLRSFGYGGRCDNVWGFWYNKDNKCIREVSMLETTIAIYEDEYDSLGRYVRRWSYTYSDGLNHGYKPASYLSNEELLKDAGVQTLLTKGRRYIFTEYTFDKKGRVLTELQGSSYAAPMLFSTNTYDAAGNLSKVTFNGSYGVGETQYTYDSKKRKLTEKNINRALGPHPAKEGLRVEYIYHDDRNMVETKRYQMGELMQREERTYKDGNLVLEEIFTTAGVVKDHTAWTFDEAGNVLSQRETHSWSDKERVTTYTYEFY